MINYYRYLDLPNGASLDEVKRKYRQLSLEFHPDRNKGNAGAEARFKEISEAYAFLKNNDNKARLDLHLKFASQSPPRSNTSNSSNTYQGTSSQHSSSSSQQAYNRKESESSQSRGGYREVENPWDFSELKWKIRDAMSKSSTWVRLSLYCGVAVILFQRNQRDPLPVNDYNKSKVTIIKIDSLGRVDTISRPQ